MGHPLERAVAQPPKHRNTCLPCCRFQRRSCYRCCGGFPGPVTWPGVAWHDPAWPSVAFAGFGERKLVGPRLCGDRRTGLGDATTGSEAEEGTEPGTWVPPPAGTGGGAATRTLESGRSQPCPRSDSHPLLGGDACVAAAPEPRDSYSNSNRELRYLPQSTLISLRLLQI